MLPVLQKNDDRMNKNKVSKRFTDLIL